MQKKLKIRESGWSAFSILAFLLFAIIIPAAVVVCVLLGIIKDLVGEDLGSIVTIAAIAVAALSLIITLWITIYKIHKAHQNTYELQGNLLLRNSGSVFYGGSRNEWLNFHPGMNIYVEQTLKGKIFNYGTVTIALGRGQAGEIIMRNVKSPNKIKEYLAEYIRVYCYMGGFGYPYAPEYAKQFPAMMQYPLYGYQNMMSYYPYFY